MKINNFPVFEPIDNLPNPKSNDPFDLDLREKADEKVSQMKPRPTCNCSLTNYCCTVYDC